MKIQAVQVSNPGWIKPVIVIGLAFFAAVALFGFWVAVFDEATDWPERVTMAVISMAFAWLCSTGSMLFPYLSQTLLLDEEGFVSDLKGRKSRYSWGSVRFRIRTTLQIVEITDLSGQRISAFDFYATNAHYLLLYAQNQHVNRPAIMKR